MFSWALVGAIILAGTGLVLAQGPGRLLQMRNRLGLSEQQVSQVQTILQQHRNAVFPLQQELRAKNHALANALESAQPDATAVGRLVIEQRSLKKKLGEMNEKLRKDVEAVLTPEQKEKLDELRQAVPAPGAALRPMRQRQLMRGLGPIRRPGPNRF
jgi:Spy/CpxP family protein refolding chaperone